MTRESETQRLLLIEDSQEILKLTEAYLKKNSFSVSTLTTGSKVTSTLSKGSFDLVLLDLNLPDISGFEVLKRIRRKSDIPVVVISARLKEEDRVKALEGGADDYLTKPFFPRELVARIRAHLRRRGSSDRSTSKRQAFEICEDQVVRVHNTKVDLTNIEFEMVRALWERAGQIVQREALRDAVWGDESGIRTRRVDLVISRLRAKLEVAGGEGLVESVYGKGYRFTADG